MDWAKIIIAALAGGLGGLIGVIIGSVVGKLLRLKKKGQLRNGIVVLSVIVAINFLPPILEARFGQNVRELFPAPDYYAELDADPLFHRIFEDHPEIEPRIRARFEEAYRSGGKEEVQKAYFEIGREIGADYFAQYIALSSEDQITRFLHYITNVLDTMNKEDRPLCYYWMFNTELLSNTERQKMVSIAADSELFRGIIETAYKQLPAFDAIRAEELLNELRSNLYSDHGAGVAVYLEGSVVPKSKDQESHYCVVFGDFYMFMSNLGPTDQKDMFRFIFSR